MEIKGILAIIGIIWYIYSAVKKSQEEKTQTPAANNPTPPSKPVTPPTGDPLAEIMREIKRKQALAEAEKKATMPQPRPLTTVTQQKKEPKELLVHQKKKGIFEEANYERGLTDEEKIERGKLKIENEGIYKIKSVEETEIEEASESFQLDLRNAVIGSVILERKY